MATPWLTAAQRFKIKNVAVREFLAEFFGTLVLILYGDCAFALYILEGKGISDVFGVTWAWGVGVILGISTAGGISGGHINPAVTVAFAVVGKFPWRKVPVYLAGQHLAGFVASVFVYLTYYDAFNAFDRGRTVTGPNKTAWVFATYPNNDVSVWNCFVGELVAGFLLMFTTMAVVDKRNLNIPKWLWPLYLGFMIQTTAQVFGLNCMAPINPARDFPTRVFTAIAGWGKETFSIRNYGYWWIGVAGPHIGCILGAFSYHLGIEMHWPDEEDNNLEIRHPDTELKERKTGSSSRQEGVY